MYQLFTKKLLMNAPTIKPGEFELIRRIYQREVFNIVNYFHDRVYAIKSNHLLCRILNTANVPQQYELSRYTEAAYARCPFVSKNFKLTSDMDFGKIHNGIFYGENTKEIIFYDEEYFNPYDAFTNWKNIQAVKVIDHEISDLGLLLPDGKVNSTEIGQASIVINIPLLLVQYRAFCMEQFSKMNSDGDSNSLLAVTHFIHMYVLPNMLFSHIELVLRNRLMNLFYSAPMSESLNKHPFSVVNYSDKIDRILKQILKHIDNAPMLYSMTLKNMPTIFNEDMQEALVMPDMARTRQAWWALFITRLKTMKFLLDIGGKRGLSANRVYINKLQLDIRRFNSENIFASVLDKDMWFDIKEILTEIQSI